jgi:hypothetical protein
MEQLQATLNIEILSRLDGMIKMNIFIWVDFDVGVTIQSSLSI